jgi:Spy/CpxP family protein refolding chaperone
MKRIAGLLMMISLVIGSLSVSAQSMKLSNASGHPQKKYSRLAYLNLSEQQESQFQELMTEMQKKMNPITQKIEEKNRILTGLMLTDKPDEKAIFTLIEEIGQQKIALQKIGVANRIKFRSMLTEEQKEKYDSHEKNKTKKAIKPSERKHKY